MLSLDDYFQLWCLANMIKKYWIIQCVQKSEPRKHLAITTVNTRHLLQTILCGFIVLRIVPTITNIIRVNTRHYS